MATYVLVHGASMGHFIFRKVAPRLRAAGHDVFTPSLTGIGERVHLTSPQVTLSTHVADVANQILYEDLTDIILLGYSYGGMVVTGTLAHIAERLSHLVYLDAFVPGDGQSVESLWGTRRAGGVVGLNPDWRPALPRRADRPGPPAEEAGFWGPRVTPNPVGTFTEPVRLPQPLEAYPFMRTYIKALDEPNPAFWAAAEHAKASDAWRYREIDIDHHIPVKKPEEMTELLLELA